MWQGEMQHLYSRADDAARQKENETEKKEEFLLLL